MRQELRPYQHEALERLRWCFKIRHKRVLLVAPTGAGKTTIASHLIEGAISKEKRCWFIAHRKELISQCSARLDQHGVDHGIIQASPPRLKPWKPVQVASVATLVKRLGRFLPPDIIVIDEAHRAMGDSYQRVVDSCPDAFVIGLTATPWRLDNRPLGKFFQDLVLVSTPKKLIAEGFLLAPRVFAPMVPDLSDVGSKGGDYDESELEHKMNEAKVVGDLIEHWQKFVAGMSSRISVVFAVTVAHSQHIVARFQAAGIRAAHLDHETPGLERDRILASLGAGEIQVISNVGILTEGWDLPALSSVVMARPTKSLALYMQMAGRGMRPHPESGKTEFLLLDHSGNVLEHGFPEDDREYSLLKRERKKKDDDGGPAVRICKRCFAAYESRAGACPYCGWEPPRPEKSVLEQDGELSEITRDQLARQRAGREVSWPKRLNELAILYERAQDKNYKRGWAHHEFKKRFAHWPPPKMQEQAEDRLAPKSETEEDLPW